MEINRILDISCVQAIHTIDQVDEMIDLATAHDIKCVFTLPSFTEYTAKKLKENINTGVGGTVGFPSGGDTGDMKILQARELLGFGCDEIDMVMNLTALNSKMYSYVEEDIAGVVEEAGDIPVKVIIEAPSLEEEQIQTAVEICINSGASFVKTGTGWQEKKTEIEHIKLISKYTKNRISIKAAGGVRDLSTIKSMYDLGCTRFGVNINTAKMLLDSKK